MFLGLGLEQQDPIGGITFEVGELTGRLIDTRKDFYNDAKDAQKLIENPFLLENEFENFQANRYREMNRVYDFVMFLKNDLKLSNAEIIQHFKGRAGFGTRTVSLMLNGKFDPANLPPIKITSRYPKLLKTINRTEKYKNNPLKLIDIYDRKELFSIRNKWMNVPLGLNETQLREYFMTGKDPRLKVEEEIKIDKTSMVLPAERKTQLTELITPPNSVPIDTPSVSEEVVKTAALPSNVNQKTGLTHVEEALLSTEEKAMRLRQRGVTA